MNDQGPYRTSADSFAGKLPGWKRQYPNGKVVEIDVGHIEWTLECVDGSTYSGKTEGYGPSAGLFKVERPTRYDGQVTVKDRIYSAITEFHSFMQHCYKCGYVTIDKLTMIPWHQVRRFVISNETPKLMRWFEYGGSDEDATQSGGPR